MSVPAAGLPTIGWVAAIPGPPGYQVRFPDQPHEACEMWLRELSVCDLSPSSLRSYGFDLLRWLRFLHVQDVAWQRAERGHIRDLVEHLRTAPVPRRLRRSPSAAPLGSVNQITGKPYPTIGYAPRTINHQLTVLSEFYDFAIDADLGPLVNPVPHRRGHGGARIHAHHNPMQPFVRGRRAPYRQKVPQQLPRAIPDQAVDSLFAALRSNRDRALVAFYLSSGVRASELLGMRLNDVDAGHGTIKVISKGSRELAEVPASADAFTWLALYLMEADQHGCLADGLVWHTLRSPFRPLTYHATRAVLMRANTLLGTNHSLHDLRHTAATRMLDDPAFTLVDVQTILRHASISTTLLYTRPRLEDLIAKVTEHHAQARPDPLTQIGDGYNAAQVRELLGLTE
ncbi:site-specific recombinase XerD [Nocardia ignorata]|uniref:Site-specific recombinase XerD n=1 Tax=Nocardia ignorata TaxID=145285 RepID=A0A4R6NXS4_NOCIG|nr:site-specific recombinase XerD [Nocardia ignorata]